MDTNFTCGEWFPASPEELYTAWLDSDQHAAMTGADASVSSEPHGRFEAWGGYIVGTNLELEEGRRVVQAWRTSQFSPEEPDSRLEIFFEEDGEGARITIKHSVLPEHGMAYLQGWVDHYFEPMKRWLGSRG